MQISWKESFLIILEVLKRTNDTSKDDHSSSSDFDSTQPISNLENFGI